MVPVFLMIGATVIKTVAPSIIKALTKQGAKKIAKPSASQIKKAVSPNNAPKKVQNMFKEPSKVVKPKVAGEGAGGVKPTVTRAAEKVKPKPKTTSAKPKPKKSTKPDGRKNNTKEKTKEVAGEPVNIKTLRSKSGKFRKPAPDKSLSTAEKIGLGGLGATSTVLAANIASQDSKKPKETKKGKENPNRAGTVDEFGGGKTPPKPKANPRNKSDSETVSDTRKKETQLGTKKAKEESEDVKRRRKSQLNKTKSTLKPLEQGIRKYKTRFGEFTVDSTDEGMRNPEDDLNLYKGGMAFGKGGMYKGAKKTYGMRNGGFTRRGMGK